MSQQVQVGIDVSAESFAVAYEIAGKSLQETRMDNSAAGHRKLCRLLIHAIYGMFRHGRGFEGDKFYALIT